MQTNNCGNAEGEEKQETKPNHGERTEPSYDVMLLRALANRKNICQTTFEYLLSTEMNI